jgi:Transposase DDE domain group 1
VGMPVAEFLGNSAWLQIARLAWNLGKWIAQLALPSEVVRWEWKRFRRHFVYVAAKVLKTARRLIVRLAGSHRHLPELLTAHARLQLQGDFLRLVRLPAGATTTTG